MTTDFAGELGDMAQALKDHGIEASTNVADLNLPGVWVTLDRLTLPVLGGPFTVRARLMLLVGDVDEGRAIKRLQQLFDVVTQIVDPTSDVEATLGRLPDATEVPALTFTHDI